MPKLFHKSPYKLCLSILIFSLFVSLSAAASSPTCSGLFAKPQTWSPGWKDRILNIIGFRAANHVLQASPYASANVWETALGLLTDEKTRLAAKLDLPPSHLRPPNTLYFDEVLVKSVEINRLLIRYRLNAELSGAREQYEQARDALLGDLSNSPLLDTMAILHRRDLNHLSEYYPRMAAGRGLSDDERRQLHKAVLLWNEWPSLMRRVLFTKNSRLPSEKFMLELSESVADYLWHLAAEQLLLDSLLGARFNGSTMMGEAMYLTDFQRLHVMKRIQEIQRQSWQEIIEQQLRELAKHSVHFTGWPHVKNQPNEEGKSDSSPRH